MTQKYYGTKLVEAWEANRGNTDEPGYGVKYEDGYISWSPKEVFEKAYQPLNAMSFGHAIEALKAGEKVARENWKGTTLFIFLVSGSQFKVNRPPLLGIYPEGTRINYCPHIDIKLANGKIVPWVASQTDMLANDWQIIERDVRGTPSPLD